MRTVDNEKMYGHPDISWLATSEAHTHTGGGCVPGVAQATHPAALHTHDYVYTHHGGGPRTRLPSGNTRLHSFRYKLHLNVRDRN